MADVYGRLTGRAPTLGPGAMNLTTPVADDHRASPSPARAGGMHKESHQYIDVMRVMRPITKWNARITEPGIIPEVVRKAFKVAQAQKPGPAHLELPEDVMDAEVESEPSAGR